MLFDYTFFPDNALQISDEEVSISALEFFDLDLSEIEENPLLRGESDPFSVEHEL
eukprot:jgi/Antlo1/2065/246